MSNKNKTVSFRISEEKFAALRDIAEERDLSLSAVFRDYVDMLVAHDGQVQVLPDFAANAAFYYVMLVAFFLFEAFKRDVTAAVVPPVSYATRLRRRVFDVAGKFVRHARKITLKVTESTWRGLRLDHLWEQANAPPAFSWS